MLLEVKQRVRQLRKKHKLTMAEFANSIGVSAGNVGDWESEKRNSVPSAQALIAISQTYHVSSDWLLRGVENNNGLYSSLPGAKYSSSPILYDELFEYVIRMSEDELQDFVLLARSFIENKENQEKHA